MSLHQNFRPRPLSSASDVEIRTATRRWVIPFSCRILKALLLEKNIQAGDLRFASDMHCHDFIKHVLLLAAVDECSNQVPSELADLARDLIGLSVTQN